MAKSNPNIPTVDITQADPVTQLVTMGTVAGTPPTIANIFSLECMLQDTNGMGIYQNIGTVAVPSWSLMQPGTTPLRTIYWDPGAGTLQALITSITTASATNVYQIIIPPGRHSLPGVLLVKPYVNLKGSGGENRTCIFAGGSISLLDAQCSAGQNRFRMDGIRLETCPPTFIATTAGKILIVSMNDCPCNGASPITTEGLAGGSSSTMVNLSLSNMNIDCNTTAQQFQRTKLSAWNCTLLGLNFNNSGARLFNCDLGTSALVRNAVGTEDGWFEFNQCRIGMTTQTPDVSGESVLAAFCGSGMENISVNTTLIGYADPATLTNWMNFNEGALYYCTANQNLYVKTGAVNVANTWVDLTA